MRDLLISALKAGLKAAGYNGTTFETESGDDRLIYVETIDGEAYVISVDRYR